MTRPVAYGLGLATVEQYGAGTETLDVQYTYRNYSQSDGSLRALAIALGESEGEIDTGQYLLSPGQLWVARTVLGPTWHTSEDRGVRTLRLMGDVKNGPRSIDSDESLVNRRFPVLGVVSSWEDDPQTVADAYLRLYALSERVRQPNTINLEGIFSVLPTVVTTETVGTYSVDRWNRVAEQLAFTGLSTAVRSVDKFPRMADHVVPSGIRIADTARVRLGAYLGQGTTVMHEGFVNYNAGTAGPAMVEGRISQGVFAEQGTDIGGGSSIMGTLSGGGQEHISIGENCLLEANSGTGISLGDNCRVEAGTYIKATTPVRLPDGQTVKAKQLSGQSNMLLRRNATSGEVEMVPATGAEWGGLNSVLHA